MKPICDMTRQELIDLINSSDNDAEIDEAYDELDHRDRAIELMDWTEQDARAAQEERFEMFYNEY